MTTAGDSLLDGAAAKPPVALSVDVVVEDERWRDLGDVEALVAAAGQAVSRRVGVGGEVCVLLASDAESRRLNASYRGKDKPTNVLSFPAARPADATGAPSFLGDIAIAYETIVREAAELAIEPTAHLQHLVVHGFLHLLGHDHATDAEATSMERLEIEILAALGVANPYPES